MSEVVNVKNYPKIINKQSGIAEFNGESKEFLVDVIEIMTAMNEEFTLKVTDEYLKLALNSDIGNTK